MLQFSRFRSALLLLGFLLLLGGLAGPISTPLQAQSLTNEADDSPAAPASAPTFVYQSTIAEPGFEGGRDLVVDDAANAYVVSRSYDSNNDVLITRLDPGGNVVWERLLSGSAHDFGTGIAIDANNDIYVVGTTHSIDFPVVNAYRGSRNGFTDAFLTKLSGQDGTILYSTYFGGSRAEHGADIALDSNGDLLIYIKQPECRLPGEYFTTHPVIGYRRRQQEFL